MSTADIIAAVGFSLCAIAFIINDIRWRRWKRRSAALWHLRDRLNAYYDKHIGPGLHRIRDLTDEEHTRLVDAHAWHTERDAELRRKQREHDARMPVL